MYFLSDKFILEYSLCINLLVLNAFFFNQKNSVFIIILFCDLTGGGGGGGGGGEDVLNRISCCKLSATSVNGCVSSSNIVSYFW